MSIKYEIVKTKISLNNESVATYGICAKDTDGRTIECVSDISIDPFLVASLCRICNSSSLSPIHLKDVAEDLLLKKNEDAPQ